MPTGTAFIAIVDDEESVRRALGRLLSSAGFSVETFSSGADFLRSLQQHRPHCVVLDLHMPHVNGFDVQQAVKHTHACLPIVVITGDDSAEARTRALHQGAKAYLGKPVDDAMLLDAIQKAIGAPACDA